MAAKTGQQCKLYRNDGTWASPSWLECEHVQDLSLPVTPDFPEASSRASAWKTYLAGMLDSPVTFSMIEDEDDVDYAALRAAATGRTTIELLILNGDSTTAGNEGLRADFHVGFTRDETLPNTVIANFDLRPALTDNAPTWYTVST